MAEFLKDKKFLRNGSSAPVNAAEALKGKTIALYFSAHWCPPCRQFTPLLKDFYEEASEDGLEIVFVSSDRDEDSLKKYLVEAHGEWLYLPFGSPDIRALSKKYEVSGIPALIVLKSDGTVAVRNARSDVQTKGPSALKEWKQSAQL